MADLRQALMESHDLQSPPESNTVSPVESGEPNAVENTGTTEPKSSTLDSLTRDLTQLARVGKIEPAIGRDELIVEVLEVLARKGKHNVILVGEVGTGKAKIAEGLAYYSAHDRLGAVLCAKRILELNLSARMVDGALTFQKGKPSSKDRAGVL